MRLWRRSRSIGRIGALKPDFALAGVWRRGGKSAMIRSGAAADYALDRLFQLRDPNRLDEVLAETGLAAFLQVLVHAKPAHRDRGNFALLAQAFDQFIARGVGEADVADQHVELFLRC